MHSTRISHFPPVKRKAPKLVKADFFAGIELLCLWYGMYVVWGKAKLRIERKREGGEWERPRPCYIGTMEYSACQPPPLPSPPRVVSSPIQVFIYRRAVGRYHNSRGEGGRGKGVWCCWCRRHSRDVLLFRAETQFRKDAGRLYVGIIWFK